MSVLVVIGFAEALSAPEVTWSLIDAGYQVASFSRKGKRPALSKSRHVSVHPITPPELSWSEAREDLSAYLNRFKREDFEHRVLLPLDDTAVWLLDDKSFTQDWIVAGPTGKMVELALDKSKQIELARQVGFNVPESRIVTNCEELKNSVMLLPAILRPVEAVTFRSSRNRKGSNWICDNKEELLRAGTSWKEAGPLLVQPYLQGTGEGVFGLATDDGIIALSGHRRLRMMNPHGSGASACQSQPVNEDLRACCESFLTISEWRGLVMFETLRDQTNRQWFVEFNGRAWGSMALARKQGLEYPAWAVQAAIGGKVANRPSPKPPLICRNLGREFVYLLFVARGPRSNAIKNWPSFWNSLRAVFGPGSGSSLYNWRPDDWKVFLYDCWTTIRDQIFKPRRHG